MKFSYRGVLALLALTVSPTISRAQDFADAGVPDGVPDDAAPAVAAPTGRLGENLARLIARGRQQFDSNDAASVATLRQAAQSGLTSLNQLTGQNWLVAPPAPLRGDLVTATLLQRTTEAHFYWGQAADRFARRDESITALTRAVRLAQGLGSSALESGGLRRDTSFELGRVLREGLPLTAPDDVLEGIASIAHGGLWTPRRFGFDASRLVAAPVAASTIASAAKSEFLVTSGKLFPPVAAVGASLSRVPPLYAGFPSENLPPSLQLDKMVAGYARETAGQNRGQWRQIVRVFYASPFVTSERRDDLPRAQALCEQFLRVHSLFKNQLGASNLFVRGQKTEGVTTLYLLEISAIWPEDDQDPAIQAQLGPLMPALNTGNLKQQPREVEIKPLERPWTPIAGQVESEPGEILFWKAGLARPEAEWVREVSHEYGHVALPPISGFRAPLEPYANGMMGETLGALWAADLPDRFSAIASATPSPTATASATTSATPSASATAASATAASATSSAASVAPSPFLSQVNSQALPSLGYFLRSGPTSPLRSTGTPENWRYLQGLTVYLERVYGGRLLGTVLAPLAQRGAGLTSIAARRSAMTTQTLLDQVPQSWNNPWRGAKTLPLWLPGALETKMSAANLVARGEVTIARARRVQGLIFVPPGTQSLRIEGSGAGGLRGIGWPFKNDGDGIRLFFGGRSGWQTIALQATRDATIAAARFERV